MANLNTIPKEIVLLILEANEPTSVENWTRPILGHRDYVRLCYVSRSLYSICNPLVWKWFSILLAWDVDHPKSRDGTNTETQDDSNLDRKEDQIVKLHNSLICNPSNASLVKSAKIFWFATSEHWKKIYDVDRREKGGQIVKTQLSHYDLTHDVLKQLSCLTDLEIRRNVTGYTQGQYRYALNLQDYPFLTRLHLYGFDMKYQDIYTIIANKNLELLSLNIGIIEAEWRPPPAGLYSNVTKLYLDLQGWEDAPLLHHKKAGSIHNVPGSVYKDVLSLFSSLTDLTLDIGFHAFEGKENMIQILAELAQRCKIQTLKLRAPEDVGQGKMDFRNWDCLETLFVESHCLFPISAGFRERIDLYSRLPKSLKVLQITFPFNIGPKRHRIRLDGVIWGRTVIMSNGQPPPLKKHNYKWIDRLADACLNKHLSDLKEIRLIEGEDYDNFLWSDSEVADFALPRELEEKFRQADVNVEIKVLDHSGDDSENESDE